jgi:hypothetical protein
MSNRYWGLCRAELNEIDEKGRAMSSAANDLYFLCIKVQLHYTDYGSDFDRARMRLQAVYMQLTDEQYYDCLGLENYDEGLKELAAGRTHMFNALGRGEIDKLTYNSLFEQMEACEQACAAYATAWHNIRQFDRLNKKTAAMKRAAGTHAFSKKKADMAEMRALLGRWGAMGA